MPQYVFISYVSEDASAARRLAEHLRSYGLDVWLDKDALHAGDRWRDRIREAISQGAAFIACFSSSSESRGRSYMREELTLAVEELRRRPTSHTWFIPVLLDGTTIGDDREIGGGESLSDIHYVDLSKDWDAGIKSIVRALVGQHGPAERARLVEELRTAQALERLAVAENVLEASPVEALRMASFADRVGSTRSTAFFDLLEESMTGIGSILELDRAPDSFGAWHLPTHPVAVSSHPTYVAWSSRDGVVAVASLSNPRLTPALLHRPARAGTDVFTDRTGETVFAVNLGENRLLRWDRVGDNQWIRGPDGSTASVAWNTVLGTAGTRYGAIAGKLVAVETHESGFRVIDLEDASSYDVDLGTRLTHVGVALDGRFAFGKTIDNELLAIERRFGRRWKIVSSYPLAEVVELASKDKPRGIQPYGISIAADRTILLDLADRCVVLTDPTHPPTEATTRFAEGWAATFLAASSQVVTRIGQDGRRGPSGSIILTTLDHRLYHEQRRTIARMSPPGSGLWWMTADPDATLLAIGDERGRVVTTPLNSAQPSKRKAALGSIRPTDSYDVGMNIATSQNLIVFDHPSGHLLYTLIDRRGLGTVTSLVEPPRDGGRVMDIAIGRSHVVATILGGGRVRRVVWRREDSAGGLPAPQPQYVHEMPLGDDERKGMNFHARMSASTELASWHLSPGVVAVFDLSEQAHQTGEFTFDSRHTEQSVWDFDASANRLALLAFGQPVHVWDLSSGVLLERLTGAGGGGGGGAFGDTPAELLIADNAIVAAKRSGSVARWTADSLTPIGRMIAIPANPPLSGMWPIKTGSPGSLEICVGDFETGAWVLRGVDTEHVTPRRFVGAGRVVGTAHEHEIITYDTGNLNIVDLSPQAVAESVNSLARNARIVVSGF